MVEEVLHKYFTKSQIIEAIPFGSGHINDTYRILLKETSEAFILQKLNKKVFTDPQGIIDNHLRLQSVFSKKTDPITIATVIPNFKGDYLTIDSNGNAWRLTNYIPNSHTIDVVIEDWQAYEAGSAYGWFAKTCNALNASIFKEAIKDFHRLSFRLQQLNSAIDKDSSNRLKSAEETVDFFRIRQSKVSIIEKLVDEGVIPFRVVHNDTKINNLLFRDNKAVAVIDLDTVGPGILYYDYGDAIRTCANTAAEDEKNLARVNLNLNAFKNFTTGYLNQVKTIVDEEEKKYFYLAPLLLTYIMGIRFLADYLNGDIYYKTSYPDHNLDRCLVQGALIESMEKHEDEMKRVIQNSFNDSF